MSQEIVAGLEGVPVARSAISYIDGQKGILEYRGIPIEELAAKSSYLETAYLLIFGALPTASELKAWQKRLFSKRHLPEEVINTIGNLPMQGHPMSALAAAVCSLGMCYEGEEDPQGTLATERMVASMPTMVSAFHRLRIGGQPIEPDDQLDFSANFLYMLTGNRPDDLQAKILDTALTLHGDHTLNASTFASRVTGSTLADPYSVVVSGICTLKGSLHGGANEKVLNQLRTIDGVEQVRPWVVAQLEAKKKIMGIGHRVYKTKDPRANAIEGLVRQLFDKHGDSKLYAVAKELEVVCAEKLAAKGLYPNVDFFSGLVYDKLDIPTDLFTPIFAVARAAGWLAHWREQSADNRLYRPKQVYVGQREVSYTPIENRS